MKFLFDYLIDASGRELPVEQQLARAREEFCGTLGARVYLVSLDPQPVAASGDYPFTRRSYAERAVVVEVADVESLCSYSSDSGRTLMIMEASAWESTDGGTTLLRYRLFASRAGHCGEIDTE